MIISYKWLSQYLPQPIPVSDLSRILTEIGLEVESVDSIETIKGGLEGLIIGEVLTCEQHPDADRLRLTTVNIGSDNPLQIVCGAPNVAAGQKVIVAPIGATVHPRNGDSFKIKKSKIRGQLSEGMICAEDEIGLGDAHDGIMILPEDAPVGKEAKSWFQIPEPDYAIAIGLTPNRADAMSHIGVAADVCAYQSHHTGSKWELVLPKNTTRTEGEIPVKINIHATDACNRYAGVLIRGVKVTESPGWLQQRLQAIGQRSVNNIVDVTNFVLHEYGQPLHAFDAAQIQGNQINVRFLEAGTPFTTLDGKERALGAKDLMICDAEKPLCIAGVFGGLNSGVSEATTDIFLESAFFNPGTVRRTSLHHGLRTDAAVRFEKTVDFSLIKSALERAADLIQEMAGGEVSAISDVITHAPDEVRITGTFDYFSRICGKEFSSDTIKNILESLRFRFVEADDQEYTVIVPGNKPDVKQAADLAEEILRIDGLDNIPIPERMSFSLNRKRNDSREQQERIAALLSGMGFHEIITNSIVNSKYYPGREDLVAMLNSLSSELDVLRPSMLESGLEVIRYNLNRQQAGLAMFEMGKIYTRSNGEYQESPVLAIWMVGELVPSQWNRKAVVADIYYLKGVVKNLIDAGGIASISEVADTPNQTYTWKWKNQTLATVSVVDGKTLKAFDLKQEVYFAHIDWQLWMKATAAVKLSYKGIPKYPVVQRDLAIVLDRNISYQELVDVTEKLKLDAMQSYALFDVFESEKLGKDKKSLAMRYTFRLQDRTLTDQETDAMMQQLIQAYTNKLNAQIRE